MIPYKKHYMIWPEEVTLCTIRDMFMNRSVYTKATCCTSYI